MQSVRLIPLLAAMCLFGSLCAQWRGPQLTRLGPAEGLPTLISDIAQDSTGYLYFGGNSGMYRYDGDQFEFFGHDPLNEKSIGPGDIFAIHVAQDGLIWITLRFGGLNSFDPQTGDFRRYPLPQVFVGSLPSGHAIFEDQNGTLWIGGSHFRLLTFDRKKETFSTYAPDWIDPTKDGRRLAILSIVPDPGNPDIFWLSVLDYQSQGSTLDSYGIVSFDKRTKQFRDHPCSGNIRHIDDEGILWGTFWGNWICRYDPVRFKCDTIQYIFSYKDKYVNPLPHDILKYHDQFLVSTSLGLLEYKFDNTFDVLAQPVSFNESFQSMFIDGSENLWIAARQGAYVLNPDNQHLRFFSMSQFGTDVRIYPGRLAYDASADIIYLTHPQEPRLRQFYAIPVAEDRKRDAVAIPTDFNIHALAIDHKERIWLNGNGKFYLFDRVTQHMSPAKNAFANDKPLYGLMKMSAHPDGWIGGFNRGEFVWFHADSQQVRRITMQEFAGGDPGEGPIDGFTFSRHQKAYVYTNHVYLVDLPTGEVQRLKHDPYFNPDKQDIQFVGEDSSGAVWMSSFVLVGKYRLNVDSLEMLDAFTIDDGMISPMSSELHIDAHQRVWAFTVSGMNCIDPQSREVRRFGIKEGLPDSWIDPVQVIALPDGRIATVCSNGLIVFDPDALWNSITPSAEKVVISQIRVAGQPLITGSAINSMPLLALKPGHGVVDIEFQGLAYPTDDRLEYSYRIKGLQNDWLALGRNKLLTLPTLSPGTYALEVKTGKPHSNSPVKSLSIFVSTPFYLRWWFIALVMLVLLSGIFGIMQWRVHSVRKQEEARTAVNKKIAELELKALRSQMNPHFMFNSLNSIKNYILHAEPKLAAEYLSNFAHLIRLILQNSREKSISMQEELETLILYIELEQLRFDEEFDFKYIVDADVQLDNIKIPPMLLQPYVENAIWHGLMHKKGRGHLLLQFSRQDDMVACIIDDDGVGRESAKQMKSLSATRYKSMGMGITQDRIEIMNKMDALGISTEIIDKQDASGNASGTRVVIRIPASSDLYN